jgi:hypothetical protein
MKLYEEAGSISQIFEALELGKITEEEAYARLDKIGVNEKLSNIWRLLKNFDAEADVLKAERQRLQERASAIKSKRERLRAYVEKCLHQGSPWKSETGLEAFSWRKSEAVEIFEENMIPDAYIEYKPSILKAEVKEKLKLGKEVPGARLIERNNLQVK